MLQLYWTEWHAIFQVLFPTPQYSNNFYSFLSDLVRHRNFYFCSVSPGYPPIELTAMGSSIVC